MAYIIDRFLLLVMSVIILVMECSVTKLIIIGLVAVIVAAVCYFFERRWVALAMGGAYTVGCILFPQLLCIAPVVIYELYGRAAYIEMIMIGMVLVIHGGCFSVLSIVMILIMSVCACILYQKTSENERLNHKVKSIRDDSEERNILLEDKNRHLIERQDSEIYVATLKERNRIAREIHDNVGHILTRTILQMGALMTIHKEEPLHGQLNSVKESLDVAMNNIRESVHDLHDESVDLRQTIYEMAEGLGDKFEYHVEYDIADTVERSYKYAMIGIVKEAISNIIKHSKNDKVDIVLREHPGMYQIVIHDYDSKGQGQEGKIKTLQALSESGGIGMQNMQDRVAGLHGNIAVDTEQGFRIFVSLPKDAKGKGE